MKHLFSNIEQLAMGILITGRRETKGESPNMAMIFLPGKTFWIVVYGRGFQAENNGLKLRIKRSGFWKTAVAEICGAEY